MTGCVANPESRHLALVWIPGSREGARPGMTKVKSIPQHQAAGRVTIDDARLARSTIGVCPKEDPAPAGYHLPEEGAPDEPG
jgi:hypothetical protein